MNIRKLRYLLLAASVVGCVSCGDELRPDDGKDISGEDPVTSGNGNVEPGDPLEVVDGIARFYLSEAGQSVRGAYGVPVSDWTAFTVTVGSKDYKPAVDEEGRAYVDVNASVSATYNAVLTSEASASWLGASKFMGLHHPFALASHTVGQTVSEWPMYASYSEETGNRLIFSTAASLLEVTLKGDARVASVKVVNPAGGYMAGSGNYLASKQEFSIINGVPYVVLNCTENGNFIKMSDSGVKVLLPIASGAYPEGLDITVTDSEHKSVKTHIDAFEIAQDEVRSVSVTYAPDEDLLYSEGFDNFVWGGDIVGGSATYAFSPSDEDVTTSSGTSLLGYEPAVYMTSYDRPGTGFIQSEAWSEVSGKNVNSSHRLSASYVRSRNIGSYGMLYRCQEHQGYISVGAGNSARGMFEPEIIPGIDNLTDIEVSFSYCPKVGFNDRFEIDVINGGKITSCTIDGTEASLDPELTRYEGITSSYVFTKDAVTVPVRTAEAKTWHRVKCIVENVNDASRIRLTTASAESGSHGFYLDDFEIRYVRARGRNAVSGLRVLYWNIQNGMWSDQDSNYENFVAWVKKYDPDVCVWCEGETIFDKTGTKVYGTDRILPSGWSALAKRYGHDYVSKGADKDNYPQIITSRHSITTISQIYETGVDGNPISHGAGLFRISHLGRPVYFLSLHLWPQAFSYEYQNRSAEEQAASKAENGGDLYREFEMKHLCDNFINGPEYAAQEDWLMMGDFNSKSSVDNFYYGLDASSTVFLVHDYIRENTDMKDIIAERNPGDFFSSVQTDTQRIDYMYASPSMYDDIENAVIVIDSWTTLARDNSVTSGYFCNPSDHRPVLVDFRLK